MGPNAGGEAAAASDGVQAPAVVVDNVDRSYRQLGSAGRLGGTSRTRAPVVHALAGVSFSVGPGEIVAVVGPSGAGKTTLLELVCGLQAADAGTVRSEPAVLMPQRDLLLPWLCAVDNAALALRFAHVSRKRARARAGALFAELGLDGFQQARPHELSGGMRQRVAFARTLLSGKPVLCLDEPFGALDAITRAESQRWLAEALTHEPRTVLLVTHDVEEALLLADRVVVLCARPGRIIEQIEVGLDRPRSRTDLALVTLRERALQTLAAGMRPQPELEAGDARA